VIEFAKFHGFGNDYIVIERSGLPKDLESVSLAKQICSRHTGAGADGVAFITKSEADDADFDCEIINPDGSIAGFSGNGTRCAAAYIYYSGLWQKDTLRLKTLSGIKKFEILGNPENLTYRFKAEIGKPRYTAREIPVRASDETLDTAGRKSPLIQLRKNISGRDLIISALNVGNPAAVIICNEFFPDWTEIGKTLESAEEFPERTNVVFLKRPSTDVLRIKIWERGAGETLSSGTCCAAAGVVAAVLGLAGRKTVVQTDGGEMIFHLDEKDVMHLEGTAQLCYIGKWPYVVDGDFSRKQIG
jgi:diaminopimelate epimerase